ncbi:uncharacterized protein LOC110027314 [Phalaenopsis equestris]|uniref:uncharacterized protein LOC110027314 n=1 Tax=Phalaenopsis equestris TaxID=78828 RepID=UPI0009E28913|nr:uncharacterized protein LOC110027314 [Phalaenopsis equestris]XP_020584343.1 uncharacterized protein LOC110027314 [Phalaenopsis equestris]
MGCVSSKVLTKSASFREELQKRLQRRKTDSYEDLVISKSLTEQFVAVLCPSNTVPDKFNGHESSNQPSVTKEDRKATVLVEEPENHIETINTWELLAGLEDDHDVEVQKEEELSKSLNPIKDEDSETAEAVKQDELRKACGGEKGIRRRVMAMELTKVKVPKFEFSRAGSLRDWLSQGGQVFSPGSYITPRFGSFEPVAANGGGEGNEKAVFDPKLVAQLEEAMEEMTVEEEEILKQIV